MITNVCVTCLSEYEVETKRARKHCSAECRYAAQKASFAKRIAEDPNYRKVVTARSRRLERERYYNDPDYNEKRKEYFKSRTGIKVTGSVPKRLRRTPLNTSWTTYAIGLGPKVLTSI